jgi:hypothetical protein
MLSVAKEIDKRAFLGISIKMFCNPGSDGNLTIIKQQTAKRVNHE